LRYVVVGGGHVSQFILRTIVSSDKKAIITVIERSQERSIIIAKQFNAEPVWGDLEDPKTLEKANISICDLFIASTEIDSLNIRLCEAAKRVYGVPFVIGVVNNSLNSEIMRKAGADLVLDPVGLALRVLELRVKQYGYIPILKEDECGFNISILKFRDSVSIVKSESIKVVLIRDGRPVEDNIAVRGDLLVVLGSGDEFNEAIKTMMK
jgi:trk system potassium uptake protein TrkA